MGARSSSQFGSQPNLCPHKKFSLGAQQQQQHLSRKKRCCAKNLSKSVDELSSDPPPLDPQLIGDAGEQEGGLSPPQPNKQSTTSFSLAKPKKKKSMPCHRGFISPPVFPKNCSLFDSHFHGGVYSNSTEDEILRRAVEQARAKWSQQHHSFEGSDSGRSSLSHQSSSKKLSICTSEDYEKNEEVFDERTRSRSTPNYNPVPQSKRSVDHNRADSWRRKLMKTLSIESGEKPSNQPFGPGADLNREWEIVTVRELCRRLSLEDSFEPSEMPLPEGSLQSKVLDEFMIRQIIDILPPRAEGYPWINIYSSEKHGFSLATLYRKMSEWKEECSPVLLVIRDVNGHVFGSIASTALRTNEHYYGTGDSCVLFRFTGEFPHTRELRSYTWTGENQFFINATKDFLSMGAGGGHYGLWLDADLNHGRSQKCATFDNEPLAGGDEDFVVQFVEAFGFSMG